MDLKISLIQTSLLWERHEENIQHFDGIISGIEQTDVIVLPEMFSTAFTMNSKNMAEKMSGTSVSWMKEKAAEKHTAICGSLIIEEVGKYYNRFLWVNPDGEVFTYDKRHLFRMADEEKHFSPGIKKTILEYKGWKICPFVCYDLRFPVWSRRTKEADYDLLIYVANWPSPRAAAWKKLLFARAIENQAYVAGVNRIGKDEKGNEYIGNSCIIDPKGDELKGSTDNQFGLITETLSLESLKSFREKFPVSLDADEFGLV